jgi:hypothetical protein
MSAKSGISCEAIKPSNSSGHDKVLHGYFGGYHREGI